MGKNSQRDAVLCTQKYPEAGEGICVPPGQWSQEYSTCTRCIYLQTLRNTSFQTAVSGLHFCGVFILSDRSMYPYALLCGHRHDSIVISAWTIWSTPSMTRTVEAYTSRPSRMSTRRHWRKFNLTPIFESRGKPQRGFEIGAVQKCI